MGEWRYLYKCCFAPHTFKHYFFPAVSHSILNWQFKSLISSPPGSRRPLCCSLNSNPCVITITQIINSSVPSADSLKHKTHPLRLAVAQRSPLLHRPPLLARFPARKQNFPATLGNIGLLGALTTWGKKTKQQKKLESLTFSA